MTDAISVKRDGAVWHGIDAGTPGKWVWSHIGWVKKQGRKWIAVSHESRGRDDLVAKNCPTRHEAVMALRWPGDVPDAYR